MKKSRPSRAFSPFTRLELKKQKKSQTKQFKIEEIVIDNSDNCSSEKDSPPSNHHFKNHSGKTNSPETLNPKQKSMNPAKFRGQKAAFSR